MTVALTGFPGSVFVTIYIDRPDAYTGAPTLTDSSGGLTVSTTVPSIPFGNHLVCATTTDGTSTCANFSVEPSIVLTPDGGFPTTPVHVIGRGFPASQIVALYIDTPTSYLGTPGPVANTHGEIDLNFSWPNYPGAPEKTPGSHSVCGETAAAPTYTFIPAKACGKFFVSNLPQTDESPTPDPLANLSEVAANFMLVLVGVAFLLVGITVAIMIWRWARSRY